MEALLAQVLARIEARVSFTNDDLKALISGFSKRLFTLASATAALSAKAVELGLDPVQVVKDVDGIAETFGEIGVPAAKVPALKEFVHGLVDEEDAVYEKQIEDYFDAKIDAENEYNALNEGVNAIIAEQVEEGDGN